MPTLDELKILQALPLELKVKRTIQRTKEWVEYYGEDGVYVSFSGGKDSTVLLHIVRSIYPNIPAVFVDTGFEYPEIREQVKTFENVVWLRPELTFKQVIQKYGYPFISKAASRNVHVARHNPNGVTAKKYFNPENHDRYSLSKWSYLLDAPFEINSKCCDVMKKSPAHKYEKQTGRVGITGMMAEESMMRTTQWLKAGCNGFSMKRAISNPMSFWTEQDVLRYIKENDIKIASVYGEIICEDSDGFEYEQSIGDCARLKTTGYDRTGCIFCGFGCHLEKDGEGRFERLKVTHPKQYEFIMRPTSDGGLGYKEIIDWLNENGNLHIKY